ncbi:MAG: hypothetical protein HDQ98_10905 [Lachnospiraceae bacterium]|nr:hypothetical protein [Lachnospiraceae bacterium]
MRIDSSKIGMESARRYSSVKVAGTSAAAQGGVLVRNGSFGNFVNSWSSGSGMTKSSYGSMAQLRYTRSDIYSAQSIRSERRAQTLEDIRVSSIMHLLNLFFRKKGGTTRDGAVYGAQSGNGQGAGTQKTETQETPQTQVLGDRIKYAPAKSKPIANMVVGAAASYESEQTSFSTQGTVVTKDGREIKFGIDMKMSRSFAEYYEAKVPAKQTQFCDPLVINLDTDITELSDQKFLFDIDNDGILDEISKLSSKSGYLALDKNGDGKINDGGELFGTASGNGFADLAAYDDDGNGWIDEDDEIFDKLLIWSKDEQGNDKLYHLKDRGVGAICLASVATEFALNNMQTNEANGVIRRTGMFLFEDGNVGTMQHVDLAK